MATSFEGGQTSPTRVRYLMLALVAVAPASAYLTRIISAFNTTIAEQFQSSNEEVGGVIAGFALGYFIFQVPGGMLANIYGVRRMLSFMGLAWSLCAVWGSMAKSADQLYYSRVVMGVVQAGLVPCCAKVAADWFPVSRRGLVSAVLTGSMQVGAIIATLLSARLLEWAGWRNLLLGYAIFGLVWAAAFFAWFRNRPEEHAGTNELERELIQEGRQARGSGIRGQESGDGRLETGSADQEIGERGLKVGPWAAGWRLVIAMGLSVSLWAFFIQAIFRAYSYEFYTSWFPAYLEKGFGVETAIAGEWSTWPIVAYTVGSLAGGVVLDWILVRSGSRWLSRSGTAILGLVVTAGCFALAAVSDNPIVIVAVLSVGSLFAALGGPATWAAGMDLGGRHTAVVFGVMNTVGNIGSFLCPLHVGKLFDYVQGGSGSWDLILWLFVGVNLAGALTWFFVDPRRPAVE